ncbi:serine protease [Streptomyces chiangmaiensis]|uniref:Serine protease n=1 Tax=Streptomyces chiangmaiensis TaxID=766497 RepID=A0ABU7FLK9_9ACTN|nr:serine protease [Streptomyces chiangmaiensis]MED7824996.1 serine protease [Streptomyces chiangmaiensis]
MTAGVSALFGAVVRVRRAEGPIVGGGFLVAPGLVCTCAHVVAQALEVDARSADPPHGRVELDFPLLNPTLPDAPPGGGRGVQSATVVGWRPVLADDTGDLALLQIDAPPPGTAVPWLVEANELWDHAVRVFGFPSGSDHGVWVAGRLRALQGAGWVQMQSEAGPAIERGFSGSPVWDTDLGGVVGMAVAAGLGSGVDTAYLLPASSILLAWPELAEHALPSSPYRALNSFTAQDEHVFCGQDEAVARLEALTARQPVVVLSGPSGSGKSSLVRAGLLPRLNRAGWATADFRPIPGLSPAQTVAGALTPLLRGELREGDLTRHLVQAGHAEVTGRLSRRYPRGLLLFADQFEEIVTADQEAAKELLSLISALTVDASPTTPVRALFTVRSGSLDRMLTQQNRSSLDEGVTFLPPMGREQLRTAITAPLAVTPGVVHEPGLVERILDDAGEGPGRLPLVEFTLTRLWDRRRGGMLTHEAYDALGGVGGAVADYAEEMYERSLRPLEREPARRLFVQLARPEEDGGFTRRAVRVDTLDEDQRRLVRRLADRKLLVTTRAVDGTEIADLAHDALIDSWSRLRGWLAADRDFRDWQERLRASLRQWEQLGHRSGALLRDPLLAEALTWSTKRSQDITADERAYINASLILRTRRTRRGRLITTGVAILALIAATLAGLTYTRTREVTRQLHAQAARLLGQDAQRRADDAPGTAALLALSAWHTDRTQPEAYGALFKLYARLRSVDGVQELGIDHALLFTATPDGKSAVMVDQLGTVSALTDLLGHVKVRTFARTRSNTEHEPLVKVSPDGRQVALLDDRTGLTVWNVSHPDGPTRLPVPAGWNSAQDTRDLAFSADGSQLAAIFGGSDRTGKSEVDRLGLWDIGSRRLISGTILRHSSFYTVDFSQHPGQVLLFRETGQNNSYVRVDPRTGAESRPIGVDSAAAVGLNGQVVVDCASDDALRIRSSGAGTVLRTVPTANCTDVRLDGTGRYALTEPDTATGQSDLSTVKVVDLRTGMVSWVAAPIYDTLKSADVVVAPHTDGSLGILAFKGRELLRFTAPRPTKPVRYPMPTMASGLPVSADGRFRLLGGEDVDKEPLQLLDTSSGAIATPPAGAQKDILTAAERSQVLFTSDGRHLVVSDGDSLTVYSTPRLARERTITLPTPPGVHPTFGATLAVADDGSVLTLYAGELARWDPATGRPLGSLLPLAHGTELAWLADNGTPVVPRPGHPAQALVRGRDGVTRLWDLTKRGSIGSFQADPDVISTFQTEVFDASGDTLAVLRDIKDGFGTKIEFLGLPDFDVLGTPAPARDVINLVGFTRAGYLISTSADAMQVWRPGLSTQIAGLALPDDLRWYIHGATAIGVTDAGSLPLSLDPDQWRASLCRAVHRPLTKAEHQLLPDGTNTGQPCKD